MGDDWWPLAWIIQTHFSQGIFFFPGVTGGASNNEVARGIHATKTSRDNVIQIKVQCLKRNVSMDVFWVMVDFPFLTPPA